MKTCIFLCVILCVNYVNSLQNGLASTPPMGWMSWAKFGCQTDCNAYPDACINELLYMNMADRLVDEGYLDLGYNTIHIDDCWLEKERSSDGKLVPDRNRFPSGMAALAKYMHDRGLQLAIYEDAGLETCGGYPGSWNHEDVDAQTFADWGIDYLKYDQCHLNVTDFQTAFPKMRDALIKTNRSIVYSTEYISVYDALILNYTQISEISNLNREFQDISLSWLSILEVIDYFDLMADRFVPVNGPGFWNDPDMIIAGNSEISIDQAKVQMTIWSIWSAPLIMSNDLRNMSDGAKKILTNKYVIAVDQDLLGIMGRLVNRNEDISIYIKPMTPVINSNIYSYAIAIMNRGLFQETPQFTFGDLGLNNTSGYNVMDLWEGKILGTFSSNSTYFATIPGPGIHLIKATPLQ